MTLSPMSAPDNNNIYRLSPKDREHLRVLYDTLSERSKKQLGYPVNLEYDYSELYRFFSFTINNVGDPFKDGLYRINTREFEREILDFFAELYHAPRDNFYGYVTNGSTEGNLYGLYLAREALPDSVVYFSSDTHYSIPKAVRLLGMKAVIIKSTTSGEIDYKILEEAILAKMESPPIIVANIGTTMKGATDHPQKILDILSGNSIRKFYIHCDAALGGLVLPFLDGAPFFDFRLPVGSISVSGYKMSGAPMPCGVVLAHKDDMERIKHHIEFLGVPDTTISGSRNGHSVLFFWYSIRMFGLAGFRKMVERCIETKEYALERLKEISWDAWAEKYSVVVVLKRPSEHIAKKWQLAIQGDIAHIVLMPHVSKEQIDALVDDLREDTTM